MNARNVADPIRFVFAAVVVAAGLVAMESRESRVEGRVPEASALTPRSSILCAVRDLGCVPNDASIDNGEILNAAFAGGKVYGTVKFPGGVYHSATAVVLPDSAVLEGQGIVRHVRRGAKQLAGAGVVWMHRGPPTYDAWLACAALNRCWLLLPPPAVPRMFVLNSDGIRLEGINFWGGYYDDRPQTCVALEWRNWGKRSIEHCGFAGVRWAWWLAPSNHNDESTAENLHFFNCGTAIRGDENQTTGLDIRGCYNHGLGEIVFDFAGGGGNLLCTTPVLNMPRVLLRANTGSNTCTFTFLNLKVDNNAAGSRLCELTKPGPLNYTLRGQLGLQSPLGPRPLVVPDATTPRFKPPADYQHLDIELWHAGRILTAKELL